MPGLELGGMGETYLAPLLPAAVMVAACSADKSSKCPTSSRMAEGWVGRRMAARAATCQCFSPSCPPGGLGGHLSR